MKNADYIARSLVIAADKFGVIPVVYYVFGNKVSIRIDVKESVCKASIEELNLDTRGNNVLRRSLMSTIGEVIDMLNAGQMMRVRNLGKKTLVDIQTKTLNYAYLNASDTAKLRFAKALLELNVDDMEN